jgi:hypothetical protein
MVRIGGSLIPGERLNAVCMKCVSLLTGDAKLAISRGHIADIQIHPSPPP